MYVSVRYQKEKMIIKINLQIGYQQNGFLYILQCYMYMDRIPKNSFKALHASMQLKEEKGISSNKKACHFFFNMYITVIVFKVFKVPCCMLSLKYKWAIPQKSIYHPPKNTIFI